MEEPFEPEDIDITETESEGSMYRPYSTFKQVRQKPGRKPRKVSDVKRNEQPKSDC